LAFSCCIDRTTRDWDRCTCCFARHFCVAGLKKPVSREFKWDNALTPTASEQLEEGIADPGLILETSVIRMGKLN
jgi:hypothetical protein